MPTRTLFQTLELPSGTWTIETVFTPKPPTDNDVRTALPADPWADAPIAHDSAGRALYAQTLVMKGVRTWH